MFKAKHLLLLAGACTAGLAVFNGAAIAAAPVVTQNPGRLCGIQGTWVNRTVNDSENQMANGVSMSHFHGSNTFISGATGKAIEFDATGMHKVYLQDNGDGTYSVVDDSSGSGIIIRVPNGPLLTTAAGAGHFIFEDVFVMPPGGLAAADPDVDQYITTRGGRVGGRTVPDGGDFCADLVIPALT